MITTSREVRIEVSTFCNYKCRLCSRSRPGAIMSDSLFKAILDKIQHQSRDQFKYCDITGMGEVLLDPGLANKISAAKGHKMEVIILTNGSLLTPDRFQELQQAGLDCVKIGLHAMPHDIDRYAVAHGCKAGDAVATRLNIEDILAGPRTAKVRIHITADEASGGEIERIKEIYKMADSIEIWRPHNWSNALKLRPVQKRKRPCTRIQNGPLQVQVDATVITCCFDAAGKNVAGSLITDSLDQIYANMKYTDICNECDQRNWSRSGVLIYSSIDDPDRINLTSSSFTRF